MADQIVKRYKNEPCAVVGLSDGGVMVAAQIALKLRALLCMLLVQPIELPREGMPIGGIAEDGSFAYNALYSPGEIEELVSEYRGYIEQEKGNRLSEMHRLLGGDGLIRKDLLEDKVVILVSDGLSTGFSLDVATEFLRTVKYRKVVIATPLATVPAVDRMHVLGDDIYCLEVVGNFISIDHYYDTRDVPGHDVIVKTIEQITRHWK